MLKKNVLYALSLVLLCFLPAWAQLHFGKSPVDPLPDYLKQITTFGQRCDWSHDGKRLVFLEKTFGDVYEVEVATGELTPLTHHFFHEGFVRALYLANGDILLSGAKTFDATEPWKSRKPEHAELWVLKRDLSGPPIALGVFCKEGPTASRKNMKIGWAVDQAIHTGDIVYKDGVPKLINQKIVVRENDLPEPVKGWRLETQNFRPPHDRELIFNAHYPNITYEAEVMGVDLLTGEITNYTGREDRYDEPEGIFPNGEHILVESSRHRLAYQDMKPWSNIDIYKLSLDGSGQMQRITWFNNNPQYKATNPVISDDGRYMAFQYSITTEITGIGHGILVMDLVEYERSTAKPNIWVYTDMSDPRDQRAGGHPQNDPDDIVSLASLLLEANRFNIKSVVVASTNRKGLHDPMPFVNEVFVSAFKKDRPGLHSTFGDFQKDIHFQQSSITKGGRAIQFDPNENYTDLSDLVTVKQLCDIAEKERIFVLNWGPMTESAMVVKHCLDTDNIQALRNMVFVVHWAKSWINQGTPEQPFKVANCNDDRAACDFMHEMALAHDDVKLIELGSVGQTGIVNGSADFSNFDVFNNSCLGQILRHAKFYYHKPDQSDASTFWALTEDFGVNIFDYAFDGSLSQEHEEKMRDRFKAHGHAIMNDLMARSAAAAKFSEPFQESFIADYFTYVYQYLNGTFNIYLPYDGSFTFFNDKQKNVYSDTLTAGNHRLNLENMPSGKYRVKVRCGGFIQQFEIFK